MAVFAGKSVLVTGGSRGIGRAIALRFAELGAASVAISYLRNDAAAEETAEEIRALGAEPRLLRGNVGVPEKAAALVEEAGPLDVLVSNAATGVIRPILELEEKHWDWTLNANTRALFTLARHAAPAMPVRYLAVELAPRDIRVNAVSAGLVETGALAYFANREGMLDWYERRTPAGRLVEPRDVAETVCFLASPAAEMIRGQTVVVDGGYSIL